MKILLAKQAANRLAALLSSRFISGGAIVSAAVMLCCVVADAYSDDARTGYTVSDSAIQAKGKLKTWEQAGWLHGEAEAMGTRISIIVWHNDRAIAQAGIEAVVAEMQRIDQAYSPWIETSELAQLNKRAAKESVTLSPELFSLIQKSLWYSEISHGAFDITFASIGWYYDYRKKRQPSEAERQRLLPAVNYRQLLLDTNKRSLRYGHADLRIDLGGIAKGYAVDQAIAILRARGIEHAMVSAGGDSRVLGDKRGKSWLVGIKNPRAKLGSKAEPVIYLPLENVAVSTSGDYERYFIDASNGKRIHHILNPRTGKSANELMSVTILADRGLDSDPLSTSVFVLGLEEGLNLVNGLQGVDCVVIDAHGNVHYSAGLMPPEA